MAGISFSGIASGIDGDAIIKAMVDAKRLATQPMQNTIESNKAENVALAELTTKLLALRDAVKDFRTLSGSPITKRGVSSDEDAVGISASPAALVSSTSVEVLNLAQSATLSFNDRFTSAVDPIAPGLSAPANINFTVGLGTNATTVAVEVTSTTTLSELIAKINESGAGKIVASAVNVGTDSAPQYAVLVNSGETGLEKGNLTVAVDAGLTGTGLFANSTFSQAEDAVFNIAGLGTITRSSNKVTGVIPGVTLELKRENVGPILVTVNDDRDKTTAKMETVVGALNEFIKFVRDNDKIERAEVDGKMTNKYGSLAKVRVDNQSVTAIRNAITDSKSGDYGTEVNVFADLGVTIERDGTYKFDKDKFATALSTDANGASALLQGFGDRLANTGGLIDEYAKFQGQIEIAKGANDSENEMLNDRLDRIEANLSKQSDAMKLLFANLETKIGRLNSSADALSSMLASTGSKK